MTTTKHVNQTVESLLSVYEGAPVEHMIYDALPPASREVIDALLEYGPLTRSDLAEVIGCSYGSLGVVLQRLMHSRLVTKDGPRYYPSEVWNA